MFFEESLMRLFFFAGDLVEKYGRLAFNLDFYTDVLDLNYLLDHLQVTFNSDAPRRNYV